MKDAFGGIFNIMLLAFFLVLVSGLLAMAVNYTKAFKAKNIIISTIEEYSSYAGKYCWTDGESKCSKVIQDRLKSIGYHPKSVSCPYFVLDDGTRIQSELDGSGNFCWAPLDASIDSTYHVGAYLRISTCVDFDIPFINQLTGMYFFQVKGDTRRLDLNVEAIES